MPALRFLAMHDLAVGFPGVVSVSTPVRHWPSSFLISVVDNRAEMQAQSTSLCAENVLMVGSHHDVLVLYKILYPNAVPDVALPRLEAVTDATDPSFDIGIRKCYEAEEREWNFARL